MPTQTFIDETGKNCCQRVVVVLFNDAGQVLVGRIAQGKRHAGLYDFAQGGQYDNEKFPDVFAREGHEEYGLGPDQMVFIAVAKYMHSYGYPPEDPHGTYDYAALASAAYIIEKDARPDPQTYVNGQPPEFDALIWMDLNAVPAMVPPNKYEAYLEITATYKVIAEAIIKSRTGSPSATIKELADAVRSQLFDQDKAPQGLVATMLQTFPKQSFKVVSLA